MRRKAWKKKNNLIKLAFLLLVVLCTMSVGNAIFTDTIRINGIVNANPQNIVIPPIYPVNDGTKLLTGGAIRNKIVGLATNNFTAFLHSITPPANLETIKNDSQYIISTNDSRYPVYIWNDGTKVYWWSEGVPSANADCVQCLKDAKL